VPQFGSGSAVSGATNGRRTVLPRTYPPVTDVALSLDLDLFPVVLSTVTALAGRDRSM